MQLLVSYVSGTIGGYGRPVSTLQGTNYYSNTSGLPGIKPKRISKGTGISYMHGLSKTTRVLSNFGGYYRDSATGCCIPVLLNTTSNLH